MKKLTITLMFAFIGLCSAQLIIDLDDSPDVIIPATPLATSDALASLSTQVTSDNDYLYYGLAGINADTEGVSPDLSGSVFYDTGTTTNGESVYYSVDDTYARWTDSDTNLVITTVANVDGSSTNYFNRQSYPETINVSGFDPEVVGYDGDYLFAGEIHDQPYWTNGAYRIYREAADTAWFIANGSTLATLTETTDVPSKTNTCSVATVVLDYTMTDAPLAYFGKGDYNGPFAEVPYNAEDRAFDNAKKQEYEANGTNFVLTLVYTNGLYQLQLVEEE